MSRTLVEFEGKRCLWRVPWAWAILAVMRGLPVAGAVAVAVLAIDSKPLAAAVSAVVALAIDGVGRKVRARLPWRAPVANRLATYEELNPASGVEIMLRSSDISPARSALRRARFNPQVYGRQVSVPPADAPAFDYVIAVHEPRAWMQSGSDYERTRRLVAILQDAAIPARVGGVDVPIAAS
jgi:hypothetical protein